MASVMPASAGSLVELAQCVCDTVVSDGAGRLCWCGVYPGGVPTWDYCGECSGDACGIGYVSVVRIEPYRTFGVPEPVSGCATALQAVVKVGVIRCLPVVAEGLPDPEDMSDTALNMHMDAYAIRRAIACCYPGDAVLRAYTALPAQGGCVGGEWECVIDLG